MPNSHDYEEDARNYGNIVWALLVLLILWWLPLLFASLGSVWRNFRGAREVVAEDGAVAATAPVLGYSRTRDLARMARDAFITMGVGLLLLHIIMGCIDRCAFASWWAAFAFFLINYLGILFLGRLNVLSPLWLLGFAASMIAFFACVFSNYDESMYSGYKGIHD